MKFSPKTITLKDNSVVLLRECAPEDAGALRAMIKEYLADSEYVPKEASEFNLSVLQEEEWIRSFTEKDNSLLLIAEHNGILVGNIDLNGNTRKAMRHTAVLGMGLRESWRGVGLGKALMNAAIEWATGNEVLELLWLQVYTANAAGLGLYRKCGFKESGIIKNFFCHNGTYFDNLTMYRSVKDVIVGGKK
jgi:RimJ/RimL family protein N-acetyltransferase